MTAYKDGKPVSQVQEILYNGILYDEEEIRKALDTIPKKKRVKKG